MRKKMLYNVEFLRFVFSVIIVCFHILYSNIMPYVNGNMTYDAIKPMIGNAGLIVECFFIMSGYFLFMTYWKKPDLSFLEFAIKKVFRLGPVLAFSILIGCFFFKQKIIPSTFNILFLQCIGISLEYKGINWYISPLFWALLFYFALLKNFESKKVNVFIAVVVYFSYLVNISSTNGGFGRETVWGVVNLGLARALAGVGFGYLLGTLLNSLNAIRWGV